MYKQLITPNPNIPCKPGWCLQYVRETYSLKGVYPTATAAWNAAQYKHQDKNFPTNCSVPVWFSVKGVPAGHVALLMSDGSVYSTSSSTSTTPTHHKSLDALIQYYANANPLTYLGWSEDIEGVRVVSVVADIPTLKFVAMDNPRVMMASVNTRKFNIDTKQYSKTEELPKGDYRLFETKALVDGKWYLRSAYDTARNTRLGFLFTDLLEIPSSSEIVKHLKNTY